MGLGATGSGDHEIGRTGTIPTEDDLFWPHAMRAMHTDMIRSAQIAALAVLAWDLVGWAILVTRLFSVFSPTGLQEYVYVGLWLLPLIWWVLSAAWAVRVFSVRRYRYFANSPDSTRKAIERIARKKLEHLYWSVGFWAAGNFSLLWAIGYLYTR